MGETGVLGHVQEWKAFADIIVHARHCGVGTRLGDAGVHAHDVVFGNEVVGINKHDPLSLRRFDTPMASPLQPAVVWRVDDANALVFSGISL